MTTITQTLTTGLQYEALAAELQTFVGKRIPRAYAREVIPKAQRLLRRLSNEKLRKYPPPRGNRPFIWSTDPVKNARGRRGFYAKHPEARGVGYQRTGQLGEAWEDDVTLTGLSIEIVVTNDSDAAGWVYGPEEFNYQQVPSHAEIWQNAGTTLPQVILPVAEQIEEDTDTVLDREFERALKVV